MNKVIFEITRGSCGYDRHHDYHDHQQTDYSRCKQSISWKYLLYKNLISPLLIVYVELINNQSTIVGTIFIISVLMIMIITMMIITYSFGYLMNCLENFIFISKTSIVHCIFGRDKIDTHFHLWFWVEPSITITTASFDLNSCEAFSRTNENLSSEFIPIAIVSKRLYYGAVVSAVTTYYIEM